MNKPQVQIFTDGACLGNPGPGGWAALLRYGEHERELTGAASLTTNNRMELRAAINALNALNRPCQVTLHTDSQYLRLGVTKWMAGWRRNGWRTANKKPVKNQDLWQALLQAMASHDIEWEWVKGHAGHEQNERVDMLANEAARTQALHTEPDTDPFEN